jgi:hypothetical protein
VKLYAYQTGRPVILLQAQRDTTPRMNAPMQTKPTMSGGDEPPCVKKDWCESGAVGDDELLAVGAAVAVVVSVSSGG